MKYRESIEANTFISSKTTQNNARNKAIEHSRGIIDFIQMLGIFNAEQIEIKFNEEHKFLIAYGFRKSEKFIFRYFMFGRDGWNDESENDWAIFKQAYFEQLKTELSMFEIVEEDASDFGVHINLT